MPTWKPFPKQEIALASSAFEILYGGARGGGKSEAGIFWLLYDIANPLFRGLVIRQNYTDLMDWYDRAAAVYCSPPFNAKKTGKEWFEFPSGAKIRLGHLKDEGAYMKYQGHEYHRILIEELTQIPTAELYLKLLASCRSTVEGLSPQVFCTANPGEIGHAWVKKRFVDPANAGVEFKDPVSGRTRIFVPSTVDDNPALLEKDPDYVGYLNSLPDDLRAWWRYGSWEQQKVKGAIYGDEVDAAVAAGRVSQVDLVPHHPVFVAFDLGLRDEQVCYFFQKIGDTIRVFDVLAINNKEFQYYVEALIETNYKIKTVFLPHDGAKRSADTLRSFRDVLVANGFNVKINRRTSSLWGDIQAVRATFWRFQFDEKRLADALSHLRNYRRKWIPEREIYMDEPIHDIHSHYADALREVVMAIKGHQLEQEELDKDPIYNNSLDTLGIIPQLTDDTYSESHSNYIRNTGGKIVY